MSRKMENNKIFAMSKGKGHVMVRLWELRFYLSFRTPMKIKPGKRRAMLRQKVYDREKGICEHCGRKLTLDEMSVHHVRSQATHPELRFVEDNCMCLCHDCHSNLHRKLQLEANAKIKEAVLRLHAK